MDENAASVLAERAVMNAQKPVILCVDDEEATLNLLEEILVPGGFKVVSAASGKDALLKIKSEIIDLILLDIAMPGMDGFEVHRRIKADQELSDIPIIMVTGLASSPDRVRGIEAGVEDYFSKPFHQEELLARIKVLLKIKKLNDERKQAESQREAALAALQRSHDELEYQVQVRTAELVKVNEMLQADIKERERIEKALRKSEKRYRELSILDNLTHLYNSRYFYHQLKMEIERVNRYGQPLTLLLLDLDDFKTFNDAYGHVEGDQVLQRLGQVVKRCLRQTDFAYRYGGEEFTILLPMTTSTDGAVTAERIRTEFKKEAFSPAPGQNIHLTMSIGLAQYRPQEEMKAFVHRADQLMYQGKKNGKDRVCCQS